MSNLGCFLLFLFGRRLLLFLLLLQFGRLLVSGEQRLDHGLLQRPTPLFLGQKETLQSANLLIIKPWEFKIKERGLFHNDYSATRLVTKEAFVRSFILLTGLYASYSNNPLADQTYNK